MLYVIKCLDNGLYFANEAIAGKPFTDKLQHAEVYRTLAEAMRNCCPANNRVCPVDSEFYLASGASGKK